jgi:hypothetical protein
MSDYVKPEEQKKWMCARCNLPMEIAAVRIAYLNSAFPVNLPKCPKCGRVFIPEDLALGRMVEVEKSLEDK